MKAKEDIYAGDLLVEDDGMIRFMTAAEFRDDTTSAYGIAGASALKGDEVVIHKSDTVFEVQL